MCTGFPPIIHMISTGRFRLPSIAAPIALLLLSLSALPAHAQEAASSATPSTPANGSTADATLFRVFLHDGTTLVSYGEFAHVADTVVLMLPLDTAQPPTLQVVSIPASRVDWEKTDAYADSARAARYAATRGPTITRCSKAACHARSTTSRSTTDPEQRIAMATEARQNVTKWAADHYGYRAADVVAAGRALRRCRRTMRGGRPGSRTSI